MNQNFNWFVEQEISRVTGAVAKIVRQQTVAGGCINQTELLTLSDGRRMFLKSNSNGPDDLFVCESEGLQAINETGAIRVPGVICQGICNGRMFLVLEAIDSSKEKSATFSETLGRQLAAMHQCSDSNQSRFGFSNDNYIGDSPQINTWSEHWLEFWRQHRLGFQLHLARKNGYADKQFERSADGLLQRLDTLLDIEEPPSLLHGDLWGGNYLVGSDGEPVLIDPAVYYGHREAEFGMTTLFGGFDSRFYSAYEEVWPLLPGHRPRIEVYQLYHLLNHLNLFGSGYRSQCLAIMRKYR